MDALVAANNTMRDEAFVADIIRPCLKVVGSSFAIPAFLGLWRLQRVRTPSFIKAMAQIASDLLVDVSETWEPSEKWEVQDDEFWKITKTILDETADPAIVSGLLRLVALAHIPREIRKDSLSAIWGFADSLKSVDYNAIRNIITFARNMPTQDDGAAGEVKKDPALFMWTMGNVLKLSAKLSKNKLMLIRAEMKDTILELGRNVEAVSKPDVRYAASDFQGFLTACAAVSLKLDGFFPDDTIRTITSTTSRIIYKEYEDPYAFLLYQMSYQPRLTRT